jgi:DNA-nicking Smr family endonuclease
MKKSSGISDEDSALFRKSVGDAKPLKQDSFIADKPKPKAHPAKTEADNFAVIEEMRTADFDSNLLERGDELLYTSPGVQNNILKKLRRGHYKIEAELDLHGMTVDSAKIALTDFLTQCAKRSQRCVRIIHGKGLGSINKQPVIKNKLNQWLQKTDIAQAFCSARPADGGTGAIYLLLKRK